MSYASAVDTLSDRQRFPHFWRTHTAESNLAASVIGIMKEYGWTVLKIITQQESLFVEVCLCVLEKYDSSTKFQSNLCRPIIFIKSYDSNCPYFDLNLANLHS